MASSSSRNARSGQNRSPAARIGLRRVGLVRRGSLDRERGRAAIAVDGERDRAVGHRVAGDAGIQRAKRDAATRRGTVGSRRQLTGAPIDLLLEPAGWMHRVDQPPFDRALPLHPFGHGAEHVGAVAPHLPLVHYARQPAGPRQHAEQRRLRQADRTVPVVHQEDLVARQRELVAAARARAVHGGEERDARVLAGVLHREARFVGELAEVHLEPVARAAQHEDVRPGAEHALLQAGDDDSPDLRVFETDALQCVGQLDVDGEVVGIQLEAIVRAEPALLANVHRQRGNRAIKGQFPVLVPGGVCFERDGLDGGGFHGVNCRASSFPRPGPTADSL